MMRPLTSTEAERQTAEGIFEQLESSSRLGLSDIEAQRRLAQLGRNALEEKKTSPLRRFLGYFWGPIPSMIEIANVLSAPAR